MDVDEVCAGEYRSHIHQAERSAQVSCFPVRIMFITRHILCLPGRGRVASVGASRGPSSANTPVWPYLRSMGRIIFLIIAALVVFMIVTWIVHALIFFFWIALIAVAGFAVLRLAMWSGRRSRS